MSRALMGMRCPSATALGPVALAGWCFTVTPDGVGSITVRAGACVHGVLWQMGLRDIAAVNAYEAVDCGLYLRRILPVRYDGRVFPALVYIARRSGEGTPRPGYMSVVVEAAREWELPEPYIRALRRWSPSGWGGVRTKDTGELG